MLAIPMEAAVYIVPDDRVLIGSADVIVYGRVTYTQPLQLEDGVIVTDTTIEPIDILKGPVRERFTVRDEGGAVGARAMGVSGWRGYRPGETVLAFLQRRGDTLRTWGLTLGKFTELQEGRAGSVFRRGAADGVFGWDTSGARHVERARESSRFLAFIKRFAGGAAVAQSDYFIEPSESLSIDERVETNSHVPPSAYTQGAFRWDRFDRGQSATYRPSGSQPGYDSVGAAQRALAAWNNDPNSNVNLILGSATNAAFVQDGVSAIVFNSSSDVPSGAIGYARWFADAQHTYKNETFYSINEGDVVMKSNLSISQRQFDEAVTHELGHTLGFRHSNERAPASTQAVMNATVTGNFGASLAPWDVDAVTHVYTATGSGGGPTPTSGTRSDFNGDARADILLRSSSGTIGVWLMNGATILSGANIGAAGGSVIAGVGDFNGDGRADILLRDASGNIGMWLMNGTVIASGHLVGSPGTGFAVAGVGDFNADGRSDILLRNTVTGALGLWMMNGAAIASGASIGSPGGSYTVAGVGDFNGDGRADILLRDALGNIGLWFMNGASISGGASVGSPGGYTVAAVADFSGDNRADILLRDPAGNVGMWIMSGASIVSGHSVGPTGGSTVVSANDYNGDGRADILLRDAASSLGVWLMSGPTIIGGGFVGSPGAGYQVH